MKPLKSVPLLVAFSFSELVSRVAVMSRNPAPKILSPKASRGGAQGRPLSGEAAGAGAAHPARHKPCPLASVLACRRPAGPPPRPRPVPLLAHLSSRGVRDLPQRAVGFCPWGAVAGARVPLKPAGPVGPLLPPKGTSTRDPSPPHRSHPKPVVCWAWDAAPPSAGTVWPCGH